jgi:hypothetical protein
MSRRTTLGPISQSQLNSRMSLGVGAAPMNPKLTGRMSMAPMMSAPMVTGATNHAPSFLGDAGGRQSIGAGMTAMNQGARRASVGVAQAVPRYRF